MTDELHCVRIAALSARADIDDLDARERETLTLHLESCERCRERVDLQEQLVTLLREQPVPEGSSDQAIIGRALLQTGRFPSSPPGPRREVRWLAAAAAVLLAASVGGWLLLRDAGEPVVAEQEAPEEDAPERSAPVEAAPEAEEPPVAEVEHAIAGDPSIRTLCPGVRARMLAGEAAVTEAADARCAIELSAGALWMHVAPEQRTHVYIDTPHAEVIVRGTVLGVAVGDDETEVTVERGRVEVRRGEASAQVEAAQAVRTSDESLVPAAAPDESLAPLDALAAELELPERRTTETARVGARPSAERRIADLRRLLGSEAPAGVRDRVLDEMEVPALAQRRADLWTIVAETHLAERSYDEALEAYGRVWRGPRSSTAANALIAGGDVALERLGNATRARGLYERYLAEYPEGSLREIAEAGRCRAVAATGSRATLTRCVERYLERYPNGRFRDRLQALLR